MPSPHKKSFAAEQLARQKRTNPGVWVLVGVVVVALIVGGYALYQRSVKQKQFKTETQQIKRIAVLPFRNMSADPEQEYFCDGLADEIINALTHISNLRIIASTSSFAFKGQDKDVREIGRELDVDAVFEGSVSKYGNRLRIIAQLVNVADGSHFFSERHDYEMADLLDIRDDLSMKIVEKLKIELGQEEKTVIEKRPTENQEAYNLYLLGKHFIRMAGKGYEQGLECFQQAIDKDPDFALAYAGLALSYDWLGYVGIMPPEEAWPKARAAAEKALEIDDTLAEAHTVLADASFLYDWDWETAEKGFQRAIALNPGYSTAHLFYSFFLSIMGRMDEALLEKKRALEFDPLSPYLYSSLAGLYCEMGRYDEAMEQIHRITEIDPNHIGLYRSLVSFHSLQGNYKEAINAIQKVIELGGEDDHWLGYLYALSGERDKAVKILHELIEKKKANYYSSAKIAIVYAGLGETDKVFEWLEKAYDEHDSVLIDFIGDPHFDHLHSDKRYKALLRKMGLK